MNPITMRAAASAVLSTVGRLVRRHPIRGARTFALTLPSAILLGSAALPLAHAADVFPSKPIVMLAAFPPGGPADVLARAMQPTMSRLLGQPFIIENLPGAGGALAVQKLLNQPADGYTLIMGSPNEAILAPLSNASAKYHAEDLALLAPVSIHPLVVMARPDLPYSSLEQVIAASKKAGSDGLTFGSPGYGTMYHIVSEYLAQASGGKLVHVPYKGATPMLTDLAGKQIDFTILPNIGGSIQLIEGHKIKAIDVLDNKRMRNLANVPAISEGTLPNKSEYVYSIWLGVMAKAGIPADRQKILLEASQKAIQSPEMVRALELSGVDPMKPQPLAASAKFYASETEKFAKMAKSIKLSPQ
jgi:tripartite-type tricarboxylate transporter receptor subunit TctC